MLDFDFDRFAENIAINYKEEAITYKQLKERISIVDAAFSELFLLHRRVGFLLENSFDWILVDLLCLMRNKTCVPIPVFFSDQQIKHVINTSGITLLITDDISRVTSIVKKQPINDYRYFSRGFDCQYGLFMLGKKSSVLQGVAKITYTSGSTGAPKGVCLSKEAMLTVANSLVKRTRIQPFSKHLTLLPLSTLLENIAGVYVPLFVGASIIIESPVSLGMEGSSLMHVHCLVERILFHEVSSLILMPHTLKMLVNYIESIGIKLPSLTFVALGGGKTSLTLLNRAVKLHLPVYEGYGLSECSSVVSLNELGNSKLGTVGKPLSHVRYFLDERNQLHVGGSSIYFGYLDKNNLQATSSSYVATGDIASVDIEGFISIVGRIKNQIVTSFGRNIQPEWIESELMTLTFVKQVAVFGEAKPFLVCVVVSTEHGDLFFKALNKLNQNFPDYAQCWRVVFADEPFTPQNELLTTNGRLVRSKIEKRYQEQINACYASS